MNYLIFRTDRIGDYLITSSLINAIKRNDSNSKISIVASEKNYEFIKKYSYIDKVFLLKSKKISHRIKLLIELKKNKFDNIIISDKKNRSIFFSLFLSSNNKIFNVSKEYQERFLKKFFKNVFLDNDNKEYKSIKKNLSENCQSLGFELKDKDFHYLKINQFQKEFVHGNQININKLDFIQFHCDEKWEIENYVKSFKKASNLTDIKISHKSLMNFLIILSKKTSKEIIITTGTIDTKIINQLKESFNKISDFLYEYSDKDSKIYLMIDQSFFSISHIISKSSLFICCHGAFTHIASNYNIKILDIIEKEKKTHYAKITKHMKNYKCIYRETFENLSANIINNL